MSLDQLNHVDLCLADLDVAVIASFPEINLTSKELGHHVDFLLLPLQLFKVGSEYIRFLCEIISELGHQVLEDPLQFLLFVLCLIFQALEPVHDLFHLISQGSLLLFFG